MIRDEQQLEDLLSEPTPAVVETMRRLPGDLTLLGVGGKMGPSLARMARRASDEAGVQRRVIGVSRFTAESERALRDHGIETVRCNLLEADEVSRLPEAENVIYLAGRKFGSSGDEATTWAMNAYLPALVCRRYAHSRIAAFSTGNVYGVVPCELAGSRENDPPRPEGEYAMSCLGRERMFEYFSRSQGTPVSILRLNYACDLRYGVLVDLAQQILAERPIDLSMGYFNTIWQGDANAMALQSLEYASSPPWIVNLTGVERVSVRAACDRLSALMNKPVTYVGVESSTALLSDTSLAQQRFGAPSVSTETLIESVAEWLLKGGRTLNKPTHFEVRDGRF